MRFGAWVFRPALVPSIVTVLVLAGLLALGFWQLERARHKEALQTAFELRTALPPVAIADVDLDDPASLYRKVRAEGRYDAEHQVLLDNQVEDGWPGFHVLTPLRVPGMAQAILVNRGWVPLGVSRQHLPVVGVSTSEAVVSGWVAQPANPGLRLRGPTAEPQDWPWVVQYVDYEALSAALGYPLVGTVILLDSEAAQGYRRDWRPLAPGFGPERHRGYAVQWFALAATLIVLYIVANTRRRPSAAGASK